MRRHLTYANVMATIAVFIALGGSSYAAVKIGSKQITDNSIQGRDVRNGSLTGSDVKNNSLSKGDFRPGQLPKGATGRTGATGQTGPAGPAGTSAVGFAAIGPDGITRIASGVTDSSRFSQGYYIVRFNRSLFGCVAQAQAGVGDPRRESPVGFETAGPEYDTAYVIIDGSSVAVRTVDASRQLADASFFVTVFCRS